MVKFGTGLTLRSGDMKSRVRLNFAGVPDNKDYPYSITFVNIHEDDRGGSKPIELQHGGSEYVWIDGGNSLTHLTGAIHEFHVRTSLKDHFFTVNFWDKRDEL